MKKIFSIFIFTILVSCSNCDANKEMSKSAKTNAAKERINSSQSNSDSIFKDVE